MKITQAVPNLYKLFLLLNQTVTVTKR